MSTSRNNRSSIIGRPWFAAMAIALGTSTAALAAYTIENPLAFTHKTLPVAPAHPATAVVPNAAPAPAPAETPIVVLDEMRIVASLPLRPKHRIVGADACASSDWRSLATGPAARQVRGFCPTPGDSVTQSPRSSNPDTHAVEHLNAPRPQHARLGAADGPLPLDSLSASLHTI